MRGAAAEVRTAYRSEYRYFIRYSENNAPHRRRESAAAAGTAASERLRVRRAGKTGYVRP